MKERPILFSTPMVRAIPGGTKTQTRRAIADRFQHCADTLVEFGDNSGDWRWPIDRDGICVESKGACPYGKPGDRLWVKETWRTYRTLDHLKPTGIRPMPAIRYEADGGSNVAHPEVETWGRTRVSIHMPRWASRLTLEIEKVRVERLNDISPGDAIAEGIEVCGFSSDPGVLSYRDYAQLNYDPFEWYSSPIDSYRSLWESINGPGSWAANPWVWVIDFRNVRKRGSSTCNADLADALTQ